MPSPLFNLLFVLAIIVPIGMYLVGVATLLASLVVKHWASRAHAAHPLEAAAH